MTRARSRLRKVAANPHDCLGSIPILSHLQSKTAIFNRLSAFSHGNTFSGNYLIQGDNLTVLRRLRPLIEGQVRCIYIDPPYNNQEKYRHYLDNERHDVWIEKLTRQLSALKPLLTQDGSLWISIDDCEVHYLKVAADRIMGRRNFVTTIVWQQRKSRENRRVFSNNHEYILLYANDLGKFRATRNLLPPTPDLFNRYQNPDADPRGAWQSVSANVQDGHATPSQHYCLVAPNGRAHYPPEGRCWIYTKAKMEAEIKAGNIWFGRDGNGVPRIKRFLAQNAFGLTPETLWMADDVGTSKEAKKQILEIFPGTAVFDTPKPEHLISRIVQIATNPGDLVLDAFLGSGTTAAVAHKLGRKYIGIECGKHARTHCAKRLKMVVNGEQTGISKAVGWSGGGGFDFLEFLGP